jgi:intracellular sulfur oxidation DsrE/DsrF family protein
VFHYLLEHHKDIRRTVKRLDNGVETLTESDRPEVAAKIQEHVAAMHKRVKEGRGLRFWDELFAAIFNKYDRIAMTVEKTDKGVRVRETSDDPTTVKLIQAHADVVSKFVAHGFEEAHKNHPVPAVDPGPGARFVAPVVPGYGPVVPMPDAEEPPKKGTKVVIDATAVNKDADKPLPGLERAAVLLNLGGTAGLKPGDVEVVIVLHGDATSAVLDDGAYRALTGKGHPHAELVKRLKDAGVKLLVCGQSLERKGLDAKRVRGEVQVAASAVSAVVNYQARGYAYVPAH